MRRTRDLVSEISGDSYVTFPNVVDISVLYVSHFLGVSLVLKVSIMMDFKLKHVTD
jgi:hypothetical protein